MIEKRNFLQNQSITFITTLFENNEVEYAVQSLTLPGVSFSNYRPFVGKSSLLVPSDIPEFSDIRLTLILDEKMEVWKSIYKEILKKRNPENSISNNHLGKDSVIIIKDSKGKDTIMVLTLKGCHLKSIGEVEVSYTEADEEIKTLNIEIDFDYFEIS